MIMSRLPPEDQAGPYPGPLSDDDIKSLFWKLQKSAAQVSEGIEDGRIVLDKPMLLKHWRHLARDLRDAADILDEAVRQAEAGIAGDLIGDDDGG